MTEIKNQTPPFYLCPVDGSLRAVDKNGEVIKAVSIKLGAETSDTRTLNSVVIEFPVSDIFEGSVRIADLEEVKSKAKPHTGGCVGPEKIVLLQMTESGLSDRVKEMIAEAETINSRRKSRGL